MPTPYLASFEAQGDENTGEQLALEIYIQASLASEWLRQKDGARGSATRSQQTRTMRTKRRLDNGNRRGDRGYRCQPFSVHALGRGYSYLGLKPSTASWPAILPNTKARSIDTAFGAVA